VGRPRGRAAANAGRSRPRPRRPHGAQWLELAAQLIGFPRHLSQHVGGFVITRGRSRAWCRSRTPRWTDRTVIQWDKDDLDALGLLKVDVLALGMLSAHPPRLAWWRARAAALRRMQDIPREDRPPTT
jgi:error-prone DNA polymerase